MASLIKLALSSNAVILIISMLFEFHQSITFATTLSVPVELCDYKINIFAAEPHSVFNIPVELIKS